MQNETQIVQALNGLVDIQKYIVGADHRETVGQKISKSPDLSEFLAKRTDLLTIEVSQHELKSAITAGHSANDPLRSSVTPPIDAGTRRALSVRNLLPTFPTVNGAIEMPRKASSTIGSPAIQNAENTAMGEGGMTFATSFVPVETLGYWVPASSQILEDAGTLDALVESELLYGLGLTVEDALVNGDGTGHELDGLLTNATAYTLRSPQLTSEIDIIRDAAKQIAVADFRANAVLLNPSDWCDIELAKSGTDSAYAAGLPVDSEGLWRLQVIETNSIASGTFLVADFNRAALLFERQGALVEIARNDDDFFQRNMISVRVSERLALVPVNPLAMVTGSL